MYQYVLHHDLDLAVAYCSVGHLKTAHSGFGLLFWRRTASCRQAHENLEVVVNHPLQT
jgi:hypothetical protein